MISYLAQLSYGCLVNNSLPTLEGRGNIQLQALFISIKEIGGLARWLSSLECWLLFGRSWVQIPATTWWLITTHNEIWRPLLLCQKTATVYLCIITNKSLGRSKQSWPREQGWPEWAEVLKIQFPTTTWRLTTICTATVYSHT